MLRVRTNFISLLFFITNEGIYDSLLTVVFKGCVDNSLMIYM